MRPCNYGSMEQPMEKADGLTEVKKPGGTSPADGVACKWAGVECTVSAH